MILKKWKNVELATTDTDSFIMSVDTEDLNEDLKSLQFHFDFSNLPTQHPLYDGTHKNGLNRFKLETRGITEIIEVIALR